MLFHDLEQLRLVALLHAAARLGLHGAAPGVGLHAAAAAARAPGAADLDDHVADLTGGAAPEPALAVEDDAAADARAPEDAEQRVVRLAGAQLELGVGGDVDVIGDQDLRAELLRERPAERERTLPAGQVARRAHVAGLLVGVAGRADPDPRERVGLHTRRLG